MPPIIARSAFSLSLSILFATALSTVHAAEESVHCTTGHELKAALSGVTPGTTLYVSGTCYGPIVIKSDDILLIGSSADNRLNSATSKAVLKNPAHLHALKDAKGNTQKVVAIEDASAVWLTGFQIEGSFTKNRDNSFSGITASPKSTVTLDDIEFTSTANMISNAEEVFTLNRVNFQLNNISFSSR